MRLINVPPWVRRWAFVVPPVVLGRVGFGIYRADPFAMSWLSGCVGLALFGTGIWLGVHLFRRAWY